MTNLEKAKEYLDEITYFRKYEGFNIFEEKHIEECLKCKILVPKDRALKAIEMAAVPDNENTETNK